MAQSKFVIVIAAVIMLWGAPLVFGTAMTDEATTTYNQTDTLTVEGNGTYQPLSYGDVQNATVSANGTELTESEDYDLDYENGSIRYYTCAEQNESADCPSVGDDSAVAYTYSAVDKRGQASWEFIGLLLGEFGNLGVLIAIIAAFVAVLKIGS